jgi:hypothetical protein
MKEFKASNFQGKCVIDDDFEPLLIKMNELAVKYNIIVIVNSSYRVDSNVKGAIVTPAKKSNHMVGHAIDCNLMLSGVLYNSTKMQLDTGTVRKFINEVKVAGLRWGGDFNVKDPIHFDDGLNIKNMALWIQKYRELHK